MVFVFAQDWVVIQLPELIFLLELRFDDFARLLAHIPCWRSTNLIVYESAPAAEWKTIDVLIRAGMRKFFPLVNDYLF